MASRAERIAAAVLARLTEPAMDSVEPQAVYRELRGALQAQHLPAIAIELGNEPAPQRQTAVHLHRTVEVRVTVLAFGGYAAADAAHVESSARLLEDTSLGGLALDMFEGPVVREREDADRARVSVTHTYQYRYRTTDGSIE